MSRMLGSSNFIQKELSKGDLNLYNRTTDLKDIDTYITADPTKQSASWELQKQKEVIISISFKIDG